MVNTLKDDTDPDPDESIAPSTAPAFASGFLPAVFEQREPAVSERPGPVALPDQPSTRPYGFLKTASLKSTALSSFPQPPINAPRSRASWRNTLSFMPMPSLNNWQEILYAHARHNKDGAPVDLEGKVINLKDMNPEFGKKLAQICLDLDAAGYNNFCIISGVRTHQEQTYLYNYYHSIGSKHPVAEPGHSPHEWGVGTDIHYFGSKQVGFWSTFQEMGRKNGLEFVRGDINHCQISDCHEVMAQLREKGPTQMASNRDPKPHSPKPVGLTA